MRSNITIDIEFLQGTDLKDAVEEAKAKALMWDVAYVQFSFNGYAFAIGRNADVLRVLEKYESKPTFAICAA